MERDTYRMPTIYYLPFTVYRFYFAAFCTISITRQRFLADIGRVSTMRTLSPTVAPNSSWAMNLDVRLTYRRYFVWRTRRSTRTTTVFCILSEVITPTFCERCARLPFAVPLPVALAGASGLRSDAVSDFTSPVALV